MFEQSNYLKKSTPTILSAFSNRHRPKLNYRELHLAPIFQKRFTHRITRKFAILALSPKSTKNVTG
jgi:hypothetical protein